MKQLGNLAIVCAQRPDVLLRISGGMANVYVDVSQRRVTLRTAWDDDAAVQQIISELNFGKYAVRPDRLPLRHGKEQTA